MISDTSGFSDGIVVAIVIGAFVFLILWFVASWLIARAAERKQRSFWSFFFISLFVSPTVAAIVVAAIPLTGETLIARGYRVACSQCAEAIELRARRCPFCGASRA